MLPELKKVSGDASYGGIMGWSLKTDYDAADYGNPNHTPGSYSYDLKDCVVNGQCDTPPTPKPKPTSYDLEITNTGTSADKDSGFNVIISNGASVFLSDYFSPGGTPAPAISDKTYNADSNPSAATLEQKENLCVFYATYPGGPAGVCKDGFGLTANMDVMVKVDGNGNAVCDIKKS